MDAKSWKMSKNKKKKNHISGCKIVHKCTNATVTVHICTVNIVLAFNNLVIFSLSLSLVALTFPFSHLINSSNHCHRSTHQTTTVDQIIRLAQSLIKSPIAAAMKPLRSPIATNFSLFDQWVSGWVGDDLAFRLNEFRIEWVLAWMSWFSLMMLVGWWW